MSLPKDCADHLRSKYKTFTGKKLGSGHAHELVAAFFGYGSAAALRAETQFPLTDLGKAAVLVPALEQMDRRRAQLQGVPEDLPGADSIARGLTSFLTETGRFTGKAWIDRNLSDDIDAYVQDDPMAIMDALSGEMAETNAFFDEVYIDGTDIQVHPEGMMVTLEGSLNGETHEDRVFHGDKIAFTTVMTLDRVAGRIGYAKPNLETSGHVDESGYYDDDE